MDASQKSFEAKIAALELKQQQGFVDLFSQLEALTLKRDQHFQSTIGRQLAELNKAIAQPLPASIPPG